MFIKILIFLVFAVLFQENKVSSQQSLGPFNGMWHPYSWVGPYYRSTNMWNDYYRRAHDVGRQFYKGWNSSGAANMFHNGVSMAHQYARQIQKRTANFIQNRGGYRMNPNQGNQILPPSTQPYRF